MKSAKSLIRMGMLDVLAFRAGCFVMFAGNLIYLTIVYFLWKAIFDSSGKDIVNGMTFSDTMIYLVLAGSMGTVMEVYLVWDIGRKVQQGNIVFDMLKPMNCDRLYFFSVSGEVLFNFLVVFLPTTVIVYFLSGQAIPLGTNILLFIPTMFIGYVTNFYINFFVATICIYTQSSWGINIMKEVVIALLSGASIPISFFPDGMKQVVLCLPFHTIYNVPLNTLLGKYDMNEQLTLFGQQIMWMVAVMLLAKWFWKSSLDKIAVNGG